MKKILPFCLVFLLIGFSACKKCFHCYNACQQCSIVINSHTFSHVLCVDSFSSQSEFNAAISSDTAIGYICTATTPTYSYDFCSNQPGESYYPTYFNKGNRATCNEK